MTLRPARLEDVARLCEIEQAAASHPWSAGMYRDSIEQGHHTLVWEENGSILAFAVWMIVDDFAELLNIVVQPEEQGRGIGRTLLSRIFDDARACGCTRLFLEVRESNTVARRLYFACGMTEIGQRKNYYRAEGGGREHAMLMEIVL
jgi:ribosomal-protein-alanine N-acetyltransferase